MKNTLSITSDDSEMLKDLIDWLNNYRDVPEGKSTTIRLSEENDEDEEESRRDGDDLEAWRIQDK